MNYQELYNRIVGMTGKDAEIVAELNTEIVTINKGQKLVSYNQYMVKYGIIEGLAAKTAIAGLLANPEVPEQAKAMIRWFDEAMTGDPSFDVQSPKVREDFSGFSKSLPGVDKMVTQLLAMGETRVLPFGEVTELDLIKARLIGQNYEAVETAKQGFADQAGQAETDGTELSITIKDWDGTGDTPTIYGTII